MKHSINYARGPYNGNDYRQGGAGKNLRWLRDRREWIPQFLADYLEPGGQWPREGRGVTDVGATV
ncbi:hypothetical protein [Parapedobacter soli]|uniref:hypothetical protein n=1 Tax=Parapedobacter soli TaxID=416955 RepID=UPI0021C89787|nr:hypothetical protein [Parapedobacter soli]